MSRFGSLEFGGDAEEVPPRAPTAATREAHYLRLAQQSFEQADFEQALRLYARALSENSRCSAAWSGQARMLIELGCCQEASDWCDKGLEHESRELLASKAVALGRLGKLDEALAFSDAALGDGDNAPYLWLSRADVLLCRKEQGSEYCFEKALGLAPQDWCVAWQAGRVQAYHGRFAAALRLARQGIEWSPAHFVLWVQRGECESALGYSDSARNSLQQALELCPDCETARRGLNSLQAAGMGGRLIGWWRRALGR